MIASIGCKPINSVVLQPLIGPVTQVLQLLIGRDVVKTGPRIIKQMQLMARKWIMITGPSCFGQGIIPVHDLFSK